MSDLDDGMLEHMAYIVFSLGRPFSFKDFLYFEVGGKRYGIKHKTFRNKICKLRKEGVVELDFNSGIAFYTLKGNRFGNRGTLHHRVVAISNNDPTYNMIKNLPMDKRCIHDIHIKLKSPGIYNAFSNKTPYPITKRNQAIAVPSWRKNNDIVKIAINKNDTVTIIIGCSKDPIPLDYNGIIRFFTILARSEGFLEALVALSINFKINPNPSVPPFGKWVITRWDFGRDSLQTYKGKNFEITVENAEHILARIYTKDFGKFRKIRIEDIESPKKTVIDAIEQKLNFSGSNNI